MTLNTQTVQAKTRVALWDNARFALIVLVVIGHTISTVRTDTSLGFALYAYIYIFHMPAMIFLSGIFAKPEVTPRAIKSTLQLIVVWLAWEGIWALLRAAVENRGLSKGFLVNPSWTLWFLVSLATMRILLPYIAKLRHPLLFSVALALIGPIFPAIGVGFSAARTLAFLPFFVIAWIIRERGWLSGDWFLTPSIRSRLLAWGGLAGIGALFAVVPLIAGAANFKEFWRIDKWLTHRDSYAWLFENAAIGSWQPGGSGLAGHVGVAASGVLVSLLLMMLTAGIMLALLLVVPRGQSIFTVWGARTLYVYLLHGPIVWAARESGVIDAIGALGWIGVTLLTLLACALTAVLSMKWITVVFRPVIEPKIDWLFSRDTESKEAPRK